LWRAIESRSIGVAIFSLLEMWSPNPLAEFMVGEFALNRYCNRLRYFVNGFQGVPELE